MESLFKLVRQKVSGDKHRYVEGNYNLDLTYITDRIIGMSFPAGGLESTYRNNIDHVAQMLNEKHKDAYMIYNLSGRSYDYDKFNNMVQEWCSFEDHHPPPLPLLLETCRAMYTWLEASPNHVAIVHCLAGKGRTGTVIAAFFIFVGLLDNAADALRLFAYKRSMNMAGVTNPSQLRYVQYFASLLSGQAKLANNSFALKYVTVHSNPPIDTRWIFFEVISTSDNNKKTIFLSEKEFENPCLSNEKGRWTYKIPIPAFLDGDVVIYFKNASSYIAGPSSLFYVVFNTGMLNVDELCLVTSRPESAAAQKSPSRSPRLIRASSQDANQKTLFTTNEKTDSSGAEKKRKIFRYELPKSELDDAGSIQSDIMLELGIEQLESVDDQSHNYAELQSRWEVRPLQKYKNPSICFMNTFEEKIKKARELAKGVVSTRAGWLIKQGQQVKSWKRRWFVLRNRTLTYFEKASSSAAIASIPLTQIAEVSIMTGEEGGAYTISSDNPPPTDFCFKIIPKNWTHQPSVWLFAAETLEDLIAWVEALNSIILTQFQTVDTNSVIAQLTLKVDDCRDLPASLFNAPINLYCLVLADDEYFSTGCVSGSSTPKFGETFICRVKHPNSMLQITLWAKNSRVADVCLGELKIPIIELLLSDPDKRWFRLQKGNALSLSLIVSGDIRLTFFSHIEEGWRDYFNEYKKKRVSCVIGDAGWMVIPSREERNTLPASTFSTFSPSMSVSNSNNSLPTLSSSAISSSSSPSLFLSSPSSPSSSDNNNNVPIRASSPTISTYATEPSSYSSSSTSSFSPTEERVSDVNVNGENRSTNTTPHDQNSTLSSPPSQQQQQQVSSWTTSSPTTRVSNPLGHNLQRHSFSHKQASLWDQHASSSTSSSSPQQQHQQQVSYYNPTQDQSPQASPKPVPRPYAQPQPHLPSLPESQPPQPPQSQPPPLPQSQPPQRPQLPPQSQPPPPPQPQPQPPPLPLPQSQPPQRPQLPPYPPRLHQQFNLPLPSIPEQSLSQVQKLRKLEQQLQQLQQQSKQGQGQGQEQEHKIEVQQEQEQRHDQQQPQEQQHDQPAEEQPQNQSQEQEQEQEQHQEEQKHKKQEQLHELQQEQEVQPQEQQPEVQPQEQLQEEEQPQEQQSQQEKQPQEQLQKQQQEEQRHEPEQEQEEQPQEQLQKQQPQEQPDSQEQQEQQPQEQLQEEQIHKQPQEQQPQEQPDSQEQQPQEQLQQEHPQGQPQEQQQQEQRDEGEGESQSQSEHTSLMIPYPYGYQQQELQGEHNQS